MIKQLQIGFVFILFHISFNYVVYPNLIYELTQRAQWEVVLSQGLIQLLLMSIYIKGLNYFPANDAIDIYLKMGKWIAIFSLIPFVLSLIALVAFNIRLHTEVITSIFLPRTPYWSIMILLFSVSIFAAIKGLGTILRSATFIFFIVVPLVVFNLSSSVINFDLHNVFLGWDLPSKFLFNRKFFYLLGFSSFLFLGFISSDTKLRFRQLFIVWVIVTLFFLTFVYIPLFIFGHETVSTLRNPFIEAMDSIDISWFSFNRQTVFFGVSLIGLVLLSNSVLLWMMGQIMQKLFPFRRVTLPYWVVAFSVISFVLSLYVPNKALMEKWFLWSIGAQAYSMITIPFSIYIYGFLVKRGFLRHEKF